MELTTEQFYEKHGFIVAIGSQNTELESDIQLKPNRYLGIYSACLANGFRPQKADYLGVLEIKTIYLDYYNLSHFVNTEDKEKQTLVVILILE